METLINNIPGNLFYSIGWTIFHSIWIGAFVSMLLFIVLAAGKKWNASTRYNLSYGGLLLFFAACTVVFIKTLVSTSEANFPGLSPITTAGSFTATSGLSMANTFSGKAVTSTGFIENIIQLLNKHYFILASGWIAGIIVLTIRFAGGAFFTRRIKKSARIIEDIELNKMLQTLKIKLGIKKCVRLAESAYKGIPIVIGSIKPYILIPLGSLAGIPAEQLETILLHELAHIRRNDFLLNLIQSFIEIVLFYHPASWWISSVIRNEREYCCDRIVLDNSGEKLNYIKALLMLSEKKESVPVNAVAATGSDNSILERIKIMANMKRKGLNRMDKLTSALMSLVVIAGILMIVGFRGPSKPAAIVTEIPETASEFLYPDSTPLLLKQINTIQDTIRITGKVHRDFVDPADNREKEVTLNFKNGKLIELIIDGKTIPESEYYKYDDMITETRDDLADVEADMAEALEDIEESLKELEEIDFEEMHAEIQESLKEIEELDVQEMLMEIEESLQEIEEIDFEDIQGDFDDALIEIQELEFDMQDVLNDLHEMKDEFIKFDHKNLEEEIARAMEEIKNIDIEEIRQDFHKSLEEIDYDKIKKEMEEAMIQIEESMKDLEVDYRKSMEEYRKDIEKHKKEFEKQLKDMQKEEEKKKG